MKEIRAPVDLSDEVPKQRIVDDLKRIGVTEGDHVAVVLSLKSIGYVVGGPAAFIEALLETGPLVVEWAERVWGALPADHLQVVMRTVGENQRDMIISAHGLHYEGLMANFRKLVYGG